MSEQKLFPSGSNRTFDDIVRFLDSKVNLETLNVFSLQGLEKRLDILRRILDLFGKPQTQYKTVHVAGTKGKGSTCVLLESILMENRYRVGRFSSPHLYSIRERVTINGVPCGEKEFAEQMGSIGDRLRAWNPKYFETLTYFELITLFAFEYFAKKKVDVAVFEVGLGGRLDATNVCQPDVTVITSISFDHVMQLGSTLAEIAAEKAGIIKPHIPLVSAVCRPEPRNVICHIAKKFFAPEFFLGTEFNVHYSSQETPLFFRFQTNSEKFPVDFDLENISLDLLGTHQIQNASLAIATALLLSEKADFIKLDKQKIRGGLRKAYLPARVEVIRTSDSSPIFVVDGAHNRASITALIDALRKEFPNQQLIAVFGVSLGKDAEGILMELMYHFKRIILTQHSSSPRRFPPQELKTIACSLSNAPTNTKNEFFNAIGELPVTFCSQIDVIEDCHEAFRTAWTTASPDDVVCVTGSLFLAAELRQFFFEQESFDLQNS
jgi:dihydrofolate synthase/folylpolyglutamate synthase